MANAPITSAQSRDYNISQCLIVSNDEKNKKDISTLITDLYYYESILSPNIKVDLIYVETGKSVESDGSLKTLVEGMPLVGTEKTQLKISDPNDAQIKVDLYVDNIKPLKQDTQKTVVSLNLVSKESVMNYKTVLNSRFDGKISDHITKILTDSSYLSTKKKLDIEETENNYNFIGNNRRPFYALLWLAKKSIPKISKSKGNSAGFFFFETSDGFKFKSIEGLLSENDPSGGKKEYKKLINNQTPDSRGTNIPEGYDGKILEHNVDTATGNVQSKLEIGTYSTRTILFDPFNCYYEVITPNASSGQGSLGDEKNLQKAGKNLPKYNKEFNKTESNKDFSRTQYMLIDKGSLPTGNTNQQIEKSKDQNFDPKNVLNQSVMRYNQFFSTKVTITITGDFSLHAGDLIFIESPELSDKDNQEVNKQFGGFYVIADLCHYISLLNGGYTKLTLVRDSVGRKGPE
ncbi:MAG: hypothetical protein ACO3UU_07390, partial [Minisyncoccia bacterium]